MKPEKKFQIEIWLRFLFVFSFAVFYSAGGTEDMGGKWLRRFLAPTVLCGGMAIFARDWRCLLQAPLMFASLSMGYGADTTWGKVGRRFIYGLVNGLSSSAYSIYYTTKATNWPFWIVPAFQVLIVILVSVIFGVFNPIPARAEEFFIGLTIATLPILTIERKE